MGSPKTLLEAIQYFSDEQVCIDAVAEMRWPDGVVCPECDTANPYYLKTQKRWKCRECRIQFSVKRGSIFEDSPISLTKWLPAMWLLVNCKNGISSYEIHRDLGVSQKTAWFMLHRLRLVVKTPDTNFQLGGTDGGEVEVDETYVGGKPRWPNVGKRGRGTSKIPVFAAVERGGQIRRQVVADVTGDTLKDAIRECVDPRAAIMSDEMHSYKGIGDEFDGGHHTVKHGAKEYARGPVNTNTVESSFALVKRGIIGTYHNVSKEYLHRYIWQFDFVWNTRKMNDGERTVEAIRAAEGKRLMYSEATAPHA